MRIFNLTADTIVYKGYKIPPNGGVLNLPQLEFIPDRDRLLETRGVLAFGRLPKDFKKRQAAATSQVSMPPIDGPAPSEVTDSPSP